MDGEERKKESQRVKSVLTMANYACERHNYIDMQSVFLNLLSGAETFSLAILLAVSTRQCKGIV